MNRSKTLGPGEHDQVREAERRQGDPDDPRDRLAGDLERQGQRREDRQQPRRDADPLPAPEIVLVPRVVRDREQAKDALGQAASPRAGRWFSHGPIVDR